MSEQVKTKKERSKSGKTILVSVIAVVLALGLATAGPIWSAMDYYDRFYESYNSYYGPDYLNVYDNAFDYAMEGENGVVWYIVFVVAALIIANVGLLIVRAAHRNKAKADATQTQQAAPASVAIPTGEGEQPVLERRYPSAFPIVMLVLGVLSALISIGFFVNYDDEIGIPLLIIGIVFAAVGALLRKALNIHLVVTTKRVYLKAPFASRVNLPIGRIAAVSTGLFHYLSITSAAGLAGQIRLWFVPKYLEVYDTINALLDKAE